MIDQLPALLAVLAWKSALLLAAAFGIAAAAKRLSASERHVGWCLAMLGLLALPAGHLLGPGYTLPMPEMEVRAVFDRAGQPVEERKLSAPSASAASASEAGTPVSDAVPAPPLDSVPPGAEFTTSFDVKLALVVTWLAVAFLLAARWAVAAIVVTRTVSRLPAVTDDRTRALLEEACRLTGVRRHVRLKESARHATPWVWGWLAPVVVIPSDFFRLATDAQRNALIHELAHVARCDFVTAFAARFCCALYWMQPLAWLALKQLTRESERACDDRVLAAEGSRTRYASQLLDFARAIQRTGRPPALGTAMAASSSVTQRITSILDINVRRKTMSTTRITFSGLAALALIVPLAAVHPQAPVQDEPTMLSDADRDAIVQRGPSGSEELEQLVRAYIAEGRHEDATAAFVSYMEREAPVSDETCEFCGSVLESEGRGPGGAALVALLAAFEEVEQRAYSSADGNALVRLAAIAGASGNRDAVAKGTLYLLEGFRLSELTDDSRLSAIRFLQQAGHVAEARALAAQLHDDESSKFHQSAATAGWLRFLDNELRREELIADRVMEAARLRDARSDEDDYQPLYKPAPRYPAEAAAQRREGSVIVEFTVSERGKAEGVTVVSSTDSIFEQAAIEAATRFMYLPRVVSGVPIEVPGVRNRITFVLAPEA